MLRSGEFSLREYIEMLFRRRWMILGVALVGMMAGLVPASLDDPVYAATATIRLKSEDQAAIFENTQENITTETRNLITDTEVIMAPELRADVKERLGPDGPEFDDVFATLVIYSELIEIIVLAPTAEGAAVAANAYADEYVEQVSRASVNALELQASSLRGQVRADTQRQADIDNRLANPALSGAERSALQQERANLALQISQFSARADQREVEIALREELSSVASRAQVDYDQVGPQPFTPALIGMVLGLLIGLCIAVLLELLRDRISTPSALETIDPDIRILAAVPHADANLDIPESPVPRSVREAVRYLRTGLRVAGIDHPYSSILVSSSVAEEGKTTTALQLAEALADDGVRVVLVDADTRKPSVHQRLGLDNEVGLSSVLAGETPFAEAVQYVRPTLAVVTAGPPSEGASELLRGFNFEHMIRTLSEQADLVIVDTPPVLPVADALEVSRVVDAVLLVVRVDRIRRRDIAAAVRRFREVRVRILGYVANDLSATSSGYDRYGGYGYDYPSSADRVSADEAADEPDVDKPDDVESTDPDDLYDGLTDSTDALV